MNGDLPPHEDAGMPSRSGRLPSRRGRSQSGKRDGSPSGDVDSRREPASAEPSRSGRADRRRIVSETVSEQDQQVDIEHSDDGLDLAQSTARAARGDPAGAPRPRTGALPDPQVQLPAPRGIRSPRRRRSRVHHATWSGPGPDRRDPVPLGDAIDKLIRSRGWSTQVSLRQVLDNWEKLVGPANAAHSTPVSYTKTVLTVRTDATVWATSMRMIAPNLVAELNRRLGQGTVTRVVIEGPSAPSWKHGPRSVPGRGPRDTYR